MGRHPSTMKAIIGTERLLAILESLSADAFLEAIDGGLCVYSKRTGLMTSVVKFDDEDVMVLRTEDNNETEE